MKDIVSDVKELIEAAEPDMTVVEFNNSESFACPVAEELWLEYRRRKLGALTIPPAGSRNNIDPELLPYLEHVDCRDDCNKVRFCIKVCRVQDEGGITQTPN